MAGNLNAIFNFRGNASLDLGRPLHSSISARRWEPMEPKGSDIGPKKAVSERVAPTLILGRCGDLICILQRRRAAGPIQIGLKMLKRPDGNIRGRDHGRSSSSLASETPLLLRS